MQVAKHADIVYQRVEGESENSEVILSQNQPLSEELRGAKYTSWGMSISSLRALILKSEEDEEAIFVQIEVSRKARRSQRRQECGKS